MKLLTYMATKFMTHTYIAKIIMYIILYVTESRKTVPNHTFLFHYIYYSDMNSITFFAQFPTTAWNLMLKLLR